METTIPLWRAIKMKDKKSPRQEIMEKILSALSYFTVDELWEILVALAKKKKNGSILTFLKLKAAIVRSTVSTTAPVHSYKLAPQLAMDTSPATSTSKATSSTPTKPVSEPIVNRFISRLQNLVESLPENVREASEFNQLAVFGGNPKEFDVAALDADELWETMLNGILKSVLGWGTEGNMEEIIGHGKWGLDGLVKFATYFVEERGVSEALFEGKLTYLVMALEKR